MKEKIYTIPVNDAFSADCECPLCHLEKSLENEAVDYTLGAAMMEPDYRIKSNEKGFCRRHYPMLIRKQNKLSLSLVLDTHLNEVREKLKSFEKGISSDLSDKKPLFKKKDGTTAEVLADFLDASEKSCVICEKISDTVKRYIDVIFYLWKNDSSFHDKIQNGKGFCIPHFNMLIKSAGKALDNRRAAEFIKLLYNKELSELDRIQDEIHRFTLKFDYRNKDMDLGSAVDSPVRTIEKLSGYTENCD